jgi:hypothetical protein
VLTIPPDGREIRHETREDAPRREKIEREYRGSGRLGIVAQSDAQAVARVR